MDEVGLIQELPAEGGSRGVSACDGSSSKLLVHGAHQRPLTDPASAEQSFPYGEEMMNSIQSTHAIAIQSSGDPLPEPSNSAAKTDDPSPEVVTVDLSPEATDQSYVTDGMPVQPEDMIEQPENMQEQSEDRPEQPNIMQEQPEDVSEQPEDMSEQPEGMLEQSEGMLEQPEGMLEQPEGMLEQPEEMLEQQPEGMVSVSRPQLCYTGEPRLLTSITSPFSADNFTKGCKWSPDGTCLLVCSEDARLRVLNLPEPLYASAASGAAPDAPLPPPQVALQSHEGELIYDYAWFPLMRSDDPATCCYASTSRGHPVHLFDAFDGALRCSYRSYNSVDEVAAAYSVTFDPAGERLFAGLDGCLSVFDVSRPGRQIETRKMKDKQSLTSQPGIVSCVSFCAAAPDVYAAGSYLRSVGVYSAVDGAPLCLLQGQAGGVTHLQFSPDGRRLYSGGRKDPEILCWDLRNLGSIMFSVQRNVTTNQRVYFDTDWSGRYLFSGDCDGCVQVWDTMADPSGDSDELVLPSVRKFGAHRDCCNGVSVHPWLPVLATSSGQRHLDGLLDSSDDEEGGDAPPSRAESAVKLWWLGD